MKDLLKRIPGTLALNSAWKDVSLVARSWLVERRYSGLADALPARHDIISMMRQRMRSAGIKVPPKRPMNLLWVGTCYDHEGYGFLQGLRRFGDVAIYHNERGAYGINPPPGGSPEGVRDSNSRALVEQARALYGAGRLDCVVGTMWAQYVTLEALQEVRKLGVPVLNIAMDDRLPDHWAQKGGVRLGAIGLSDAVDLTLQTSPECVRRYMNEGAPAMYWPFGSDPEIFKPHQPRDLDAVFIGNNYGKRGELCSALSKSGVALHCYGAGFSNGYIDGARVPELFGRAKIILGSGFIGHSSRIVTLKLRDFDGPMAGGLYLTNYNSDLAAHFEFGNEIVGYRSVDECVRLVRHFLLHDDERHRIAAAGRDRALRDHTWSLRLGEAFETLQLAA